MKLFITTLLTLTTLAAGAVQAPVGKKVERMLRSPGARELMDEEVQAWHKAKLLEVGAASADASTGGSVVLRGTPSPAQRFNRGKLIRCEPRMIGGGQFAAIRHSCDTDHPIYLPLSVPGKDQAIPVAAGFYVLGFENSVYPGFLQVKTGEQKVVQLQAVAIPAGGNVKIYRDTTSLVEELKLYFTTYTLGESVFHLSETSFGDLYIKAFGTRDGAVPLTYKTCEEAKIPKMTARGDRICKAWNMGTFMMLTEMYNFAGNGSFMQWEVGDQGKPYPYPSARLLVAKRTSSDVAPFVNVLPGVYALELTDAAGHVTTRSTGAVGEVNTANPLAMNVGWLPPAAKLTMNGKSAIAVPGAIDPTSDPNAPTAAQLASAADDGGGSDVYVNPNETCGSARMWRTDLRSYCTSDSQDGCARSRAKVCEPVYDNLP